VSTWSDKIGWMSETRSVASMARDTGIPYRTLLRVRAGADLNTEYIPDAQSLYGKETYNRLKGAGIPTRIATNMRGGNLENIVSNITNMRDKVDFLAKGSFLMSYKKPYDTRMTPAEQVWLNNIKSKIISSLNKSFQELDAIYSDNY